MDTQHIQEVLRCFLPAIVFLVVWEITWKLIGLWKAARNKHLAWFICIALINTAGILPIIYILTHKQEPSDTVQGE